MHTISFGKEGLSAKFSYANTTTSAQSFDAVVETFKTHAKEAMHGVATGT